MSVYMSIWIVWTSMEQSVSFLLGLKTSIQQFSNILTVNSHRATLREKIHT